MGEPKDLNNPNVYADALARAVLNPQREALAAWLAGEPETGGGEGEGEGEGETTYPFQQWYLFFADRLLDLMPHPELGFQARPKRLVSAPKIGRNDACPCGSGKKYKQCHLTSDGDDAGPRWKMGSPTPIIRAMSIANLVPQLPLATLDAVPLDMASNVTLTEMASVYHANGRMEDALQLVKRVLDGDREDPFMLYDYWIARYAEWLVQVERAEEGEQFLMDEFDNPRQVHAWQVAQKLAAFYLDQDDLIQAETWVDAALEGDAENPFNYYLKGLLAHSNSLWETAISAYEQARTFSDRFREEEKGYMSQLVSEALERANNHQPMEEEDEEETQTTQETQGMHEKTGEQ